MFDLPVHTQNKHSIRIHTHLGSNMLMATGATITEAMSSPFLYEVDVYSDKRHDLDARDLVGTPAVLEIVADDNKLISRNGYITSFTCTGTETRKDKTRYRLTIEPWLALLRDVNNCRIFQNKDVKGVIDSLFLPIPESNCDVSGLRNTYKTREYWVQHNESILDYFHRICALEGIAYYFDHQDKDHILRLVDQALLLPNLTGTNPLKIQPANQAHESLTSWMFLKKFVVGKATQRSYNHRTPSQLLESRSQVDAEVGEVPRITNLESYQYSESFDSIAEGNNETARLAHRKGTSRHGVWTATGDYRHLMVGRRFTVVKVPFDITFKDNATPFNITKLTMQMDDEQGDNQVHIEATNKDALVFPEGGTPKRMLGSETARVTGPKGSEICTNEYGQIKVQFHWDREGKNDNNTTCWLRVAQAMAGPNFGAHYTPRVGQEVVVSFENGNPDKPFVSGTLYHHEHLPPFAKDDGLRSGFRSHSSKGGGPNNYNELSFYDKKGSEEIYIQAEKDLNANIKHNETHKVGDTLHIKAGKKIILEVGGSVVTITGSKIAVSSSLVDIDGSTIKLN